MSRRDQQRLEDILAAIEAIRDIWGEATCPTAWYSMLCVFASSRSARR